MRDMDPSLPSAPLPRYGDPSLGAEGLRALEVSPLPEPAPESGVIVERSPSGALQLRLLGRGAPGPVTIDFAGAAFQRRLDAGKRGPLGRAVGLAKGASPRIIEASRRCRPARANTSCQLLTIDSTVWGWT